MSSGGLGVISRGTSSSHFSASEPASGASKMPVQSLRLSTIDKSVLAFLGEQGVSKPSCLFSKSSLREFMLILFLLNC